MYYTVKFCCKNSRPGYNIVKANNCYEAISKFFASWTKENGCDIPVTDLVWFRIESWCDSSEMIGEE